MTKLEDKPSYQRHLQWQRHYKEVVAKHKKNNPDIFNAINRSVFYQEVADHFGYSFMTVYNAIRALTKDKK